MRRGLWRLNAWMPRRRGCRRSIRAMTLLELLVAITMLASLSGMVAALWSQTRAWSGENTRLEHALDARRALDLMRRQWADRRSMVALGEDGLAVRLTEERLEFVTTSPAVAREWPLVRAAFIIERDPPPGFGEPAPSRLVYEETPIVAPGATDAKLSATSGVATPESERIVLLEGCFDLRWEQRAPRQAAPAGLFDASAPMWTAVKDESGLYAGKAGGGARLQTREELESASREADRNEDPKAAPGAGKAKPEEEEEADQPEEAVRLSTFRITGTWQDKEFTCLFVIAPSRS